MSAWPAARLLELLTRLALAPAHGATPNRCALEGVRWQRRGDGMFEAGVDTLELTALELALGPLTLEIDRLVVHKLCAQLRLDAGMPSLSALQAEAVELSGLRLRGRLTDLAPSAVPAKAPTRPWCLGPLEEAQGTIHGNIRDAELLFDAHVTVPIRHGQINFNDASVEHIGPDSRMGVSRLGVYVDAPTGRSYLYQFASAPLVGVAFEQRGALLGPWITERGKLWLKAFAEALLGRAHTGQDQGLTQQARLLLARTALSGQLQLGDAQFALPGLQGRTQGSTEGRNALALASKAVGQGLSLTLAALSVRELAAQWAGLALHCDALSASVALELVGAEPDTAFMLTLQEARMGPLRLEA